MIQVKFLQDGIEVDGEYTHLTRREMEILTRLYGSRGRVWNTDDLAELLIISPLTVRLYMKKLRDKLGNDAIKNRRGHGYSIGDRYTDDTTSG